MHVEWLIALIADDHGSLGRILGIKSHIDLPGLDGASVCRQMRAEADTPIIVVSGERDRAATAQLLDLGADDYVRKPFRGDELLARIRAVRRRRAAAAAPAPGVGGLEDGDAGWALDLRRHEIRWQGAPVPVFAHVPLILGADKKRLSKRHGATSVMEYVAAGDVTGGDAMAYAGCWPCDGDGA